MTRGKYANRSDAATARRDAIQETERLKRDLAELRKENDRLARTVLETMEAHDKSLTSARQQIAAATSPELEAARARADSLVADLADSEAARKKDREAHERFFGRLHEHFMEEHGMTGTDALNVAIRWTGNDGVLVSDPALRKIKDTEGAMRIMLARGEITKASLGGDES